VTHFYKIRFFGGLGDCLKMITEQTSLCQFHKENRLLIYWVYSDMNIVDLVYSRFHGSKIKNNQWAYIRDYDKVEDYNTGHTTTVSGSYPVHQALHDLLKEFNFFYLTDQNYFANSDAIELNNFRCNQYPNYKHDKQLKGLYKDEKGGLIFQKEDYHITSLLEGVETSFCFQLSGSNSQKIYDVNNHIKIFKMILDAYPKSKIFLIDKPNYVVDSSLLFDDRIVSLIGKVSIVQCAKLIQKVDYLVAPDSYSKYIRKWVDGKQILLCHKLDCHPNERQILHDAFNIVGLCNNPDVKLLGVTYTTNNKNEIQSASFVPTMNDILPEEIFNAIQSYQPSS
jgi:hypothetical protein